jgi:hypothetical protein
MTEEEAESQIIVASKSIQGQVKPILEAPANTVLMETKQKINNVAQKEEAMHYLGLTRKKYMRVIIDALEAYKWSDVVDRQGNVKLEWVPDIDKQRWGAEQAAKLFGDYIQHVDANVRVTHSVEELLNVFEKAQRKKVE